MNRIYIDCVEDNENELLCEFITYSENQKYNNIILQVKSNNEEQVKTASNLFKYIGDGTLSYGQPKIPFAIASWEPEDVWHKVASMFIEYGEIPYKSIMQNPLSKYPKKDIFLSVKRIATQGAWIKPYSMNDWLKMHKILCNKLQIDLDNIFDDDILTSLEPEMFLSCREDIAKNELLINSALKFFEEINTDNKEKPLPKEGVDYNNIKKDQILKALHSRLITIRNIDLYYELLVG